MTGDERLAKTTIKSTGGENRNRSSVRSPGIVTVDGFWRAVGAGARMTTSEWIRPWAEAVLPGWSQIGGFGGPNALQIFPLDGNLPGSGSSLIAAQRFHSRNGQWQVQDWLALSRIRLLGTQG
jgi:hypothetical protein